MSGRTSAPAMRVLVFCGATRVFGMEKKTLALMDGLQRGGHTVFCVTSGWNDGDFLSRLRLAGIAHTTARLGKITLSPTREHMTWMMNTLRYWPDAVRHCRAVIREFRPDVVLVSNRDHILLLALILPRSRTVFHVSELAAMNGRTKSTFNVIDRCVAAYIAVSGSIRDRLVKLGVPTAKVHVVHNGMERVADLEAGRRPVAAATPVIGIVGQVGEWKGHEDLIDALAILKTRGIPFGCSIFGDGDAGFVTALKERAHAAGLTASITWHGYVRDTDSMYRHMDICVMPTRTAEPFGNVALEAGLRKIPVVATRVGGLPEIIVDGETGFLEDPGQPAALAERLSELLRDADLRDRLGAAAHRRVSERFTVDVMVEGVEQVFRRVMTLAARQPSRGAA